ncbi:MAG: response regulator, partial [bacterium]|nr:response regulator [bacterium]
TFIVQLPMGSSHLEPNERASPAQGALVAGKGAPVSDKDIPMPEAGSGAESGLEAGAGDKSGAIEKEIILVVEDSADVREYIRGALESGYTIIEAQEGDEGFRKAQESIPDLIISDIMMPGVDGLELCNRLKKEIKTSHIPIILLTAKAGEESIVEGLETGADDYITKPFSIKILMARIRNLIELRRQMQLNINRGMTIQTDKIAVSAIDREFIKDLQDAINTNLPDTEFNVEALAKKLYMDRSTIYRKVLALTGETPTDFIRSCRLKRGAELLKNGHITVLEVALEVGFSSANYFTKCFKKKFHQLPSEFQAEKSPGKE